MKILNIFVDIDKTICTGPPKEDPLNYLLVKPIQTRIAIINKLYDAGHIITYWTARGSLSGIQWFHQTYSQLQSWGCQFHELRMGKPVYDLFIDDKACSDKDFFNDPAKFLEHMDSWQ